MSHREADVVVVGAGLAGLVAARRLVEAGLEPVVLEARDRVGGRTLNHDLGGGQVVELGGQWVGPSQHRMLALTREVGVETFPTYNEGQNVVEWRGRLRRYRGPIPRINPAVLADTGRVQLMLDRLARTVPVDTPWLAPRARELDSMTFDTWLRRATLLPGTRTLFEIGVEAVWAQEPRDLSLLHVLFYINSAGGFDALIGTDGGAQEQRFAGGSQLVSLRMAEQLGDRIVLSAPVRRIADRGDTVSVEADGVTVTGRRVIVAIPPALTPRIAFDPPLPGIRDQLVQRMPQGTVAKCMAIYDRPFWRDGGFTGQATSDVGPVRTTFDNTPPSGAPGVLLAFLEGDYARRQGRLAPDQRQRNVLGCLTRFFGPAAAHPVDWVEQHWAEEQWTRGCYGCAMPTGAWTSFGDTLRAPIGGVHWAGAETATVWSGYMDGAVQSGERAAREVAAELAAAPAG